MQLHPKRISKMDDGDDFVQHIVVEKTTKQLVSLLPAWPCCNLVVTASDFRPEGLRSMAVSPNTFRVHTEYVLVKSDTTTTTTTSSRQHAMETSQLTYTLTIQSSAFSRKGDVDGLMGQRFHFDDGVKATVLNWFRDRPTLFLADGIRNLPKQ
ncbi:hypothetical protein TNCV_4466611 [Trichonephila clavipes]|nr:hypothetical protein TNCV_4466611 [Trichonephila clavipes]